MEIQVQEDKKIYSVGELTRQIRFTLEGQFGAVWVEGQIANFIHHSSGHMYFSIRDQDSTLQCVMFKRDNARLPFTPEVGMKVLVFGMISVYLPRGQYQLTVQMMQPKGIGDLQVAFEQLKNKLLKEGLFDEDHKLPLPFLPERIGIITSPTGAVIQDIQHVLDRRYAEHDLVIAPVQVQGDKAKDQICDAIQILNAREDIDVIIIARGGGSLEDLWAFNEEVVARAIFESHIPIISAIGHEVDYTIADFVADLRAPTPSAAAELVLPNKKDLEATIRSLTQRLIQGPRLVFESLRERFDSVKRSKVITDPGYLLDPYFQRLDECNKSMEQSFGTGVKFQVERISSIQGQLKALSPLACLSRGYSIVVDSTLR